MRIVNLEEFRKLPPFTAYHKYTPQVYGELEIKGKTLECDFISQGICGFIESATGCSEDGEMQEHADATGETFRFDLDIFGRDGLFEHGQLFAVYDNEDILALVSLLGQCIH